MNDDIIWAWDLDEKQFVPLIKAGDCFEPPKNVGVFRFTIMQKQKEAKTHEDMLDEIKKLFEEK